MNPRKQERLEKRGLVLNVASCPLCGVMDTHHDPRTIRAHQRQHDQREAYSAIEASRILNKRKLR